MSDLRAACEHGRYEKHAVKLPGSSDCIGTTIVRCPGGREVTIDYEAARRKARDILLNDASLLADPYPAIVDAAIGDTE